MYYIVASTMSILFVAPGQGIKVNTKIIALKLNTRRRNACKSGERRAREREGGARGQVGVGARSGSSHNGFRYHIVRKMSHEDNRCHPSSRDPGRNIALATKLGASYTSKAP